MQFQALDQHADTARLIPLGKGINLPTANFVINAALADGIEVNLTTYLSSRHHNEAWVKGGYLLIDRLPFLNSATLDKAMELLTFKVGVMELNYGDAHFRRTDNGNAIKNPFVGNHIIDAFTTAPALEVLIRKSGILVILFILIFLPLTGFKTDDVVPDGKVKTNGFIYISVESNVNRIFFTYPFNEINIENKNSHGGKLSETASIDVPVRDFRCPNKTALSDFLDLLKADQYPYLSITIPGNSIKPEDTDKHVIIKNVTITVAGISKEYDIDSRIEKGNSDDHFLVGTVKISLTDMGMEPPEKIFGLLKVKDEVIVKFGISLKEYNLAVNNYNY